MIVVGRQLKNIGGIVMASKLLRGMLAVAVAVAVPFASHSDVVGIAANQSPQEFLAGPFHSGLYHVEVLEARLEKENRYEFCAISYNARVLDAVQGEELNTLRFCGDYLSGVTVGGTHLVFVRYFTTPPEWGDDWPDRIVKTVGPHGAPVSMAGLIEFVESQPADFLTDPDNTIGHVTARDVFTLYENPQFGEKTTLTIPAPHANFPQHLILSTYTKGEIDADGAMVSTKYLLVDWEKLRGMVE